MPPHGRPTSAKHEGLLGRDALPTDGRVGSIASGPSASTSTPLKWVPLADNVPFPDPGQTGWSDKCCGVCRGTPACCISPLLRPPAPLFRALIGILLQPRPGLDTHRRTDGQQGYHWAWVRHAALHRSLAQVDATACYARESPFELSSLCDSSGLSGACTFESPTLWRQGG